MSRCLAVLFACAAVSLAQSTDERMSKAYDIRFLTMETENFRGPELGIENAGSEDFLVGAVQENGRSPITGDFLATAIRTNFDEDSWSDERNRIEYADGVLYVTQTKENHERISKYIEMLRKRFSRRVVVEAEILLVSPDAFAASGAAPGLLSADAEKALRDAAGDASKGRLLGMLRATAANGQRVYAADLRETSYVRDYDVEIAQDSAIADPVAGQLATGTVLDVRPILSNDLQTVLMETRFRLAVPRGLSAFEPGGAVLGRIQLPKHDALRTKTTLALPVGKSALLCAGPVPGEKDWIAAVVVRPTITGAAGTDETSSTEKRQMRMFDVSILTAGVRDFPGPRIEVSYRDEGGAPTTSFMPPSDEGEGISAEALIATIQSAVAPESWKNQRNRLETMGDQVIAVQKPEILDEIGKFLAVAAPARNRIIGVEAVVVGLDEVAWNERRAALSGASPSEDALKELMAAAAKGGGVRMLGSARGAGMSEQRFHVFAGTAQSYVQDDDVEIAQSVGATDPIIGTLLTGCILDIRALLGADGKTILAEVRPAYNAAPDPETFDPKAPNVSKVQMVRASLFKVETTLYMPDGAWTLAGTATAVTGGKREVRAMLLRARSMEAK